MRASRAPVCTLLLGRARGQHLRTPAAPSVQREAPARWDPRQEGRAQLGVQFSSLFQTCNSTPACETALNCAGMAAHMLPAGTRTARPEQKALGRGGIETAPDAGTGPRKELTHLRSSTTPGSPPCWSEDQEVPTVPASLLSAVGFICWFSGPFLGNPLGRFSEYPQQP